MNLLVTQDASINIEYDYRGYGIETICLEKIHMAIYLSRLLEMSRRDRDEQSFRTVRVSDASWRIAS
jgi:hypothetical protein